MPFQLRGGWMPRSKYFRHQARGEAFLLTSPFIGLGDEMGVSLWLRISGLISSDTKRRSASRSIRRGFRQDFASLGPTPILQTVVSTTLSRRVGSALVQESNGLNCILADLDVYAPVRLDRNWLLILFQDIG